MSVREQIIETTSRLLEQQGYHASGLNQIVQESGAPKGSLYYYFPLGKEELTAEAIERSARGLTTIIETELARYEDPAEAIEQFMHGLAGHVEASECRGGAPIATVALETAGRSDRLTAACQAAYQSYQSAFSARPRGRRHRARAGGPARHAPRRRHRRRNHPQPDAAQRGPAPSDRRRPAHPGRPSTLTSR